ncbi:hypothetical protein [Fusobacterium sp. MFO224]|uniref:hypothetical protein n=1 Tax=Fusobacterium sp. MFO224 TaxID=3378070 RepID=UPI003853782C
MSARIVMATPFINKEILCQSLEENNIKYEKNQGKIIISELYGYYEKGYFKKDDLGKYLFHYEQESTDKAINLKDLVRKSYKRITKEIEAEKIKEEKRSYIEAQRKKILERAKKQGYSIKETQKNGKIQLVLLRTRY